MSTDQISSKTHRRGFLGLLASGAAAIGFSAIANPLKAGASIIPASGSENDLDAWVNKIKGTQKVVFDATQPHDVFPFAWPRVFMMTNEKTGVKPEDLGVVVILRHSAIGYAFENRLWNEYKFGELFGANDPKTKAPATRNPFWKPAPGDFSIPGVGQVAIGINELQANGVMFAVCETAMTVYSAVVAEKIKKDPKEVRADWVSGMLPGIQPVPSGVWAIGRAQGKGCAYIFAG